VISKKIGLVFAAALLAGCSTLNQAGAAVVVGDERLTIAQLDAYSAEVREVLAADGSAGIEQSVEFNRIMVQNYVLDQLAALMAAEYGVSATEAQIEAIFQEQVAAVGSEEILYQMAASAGIAPSFLDDYFRSLVNLQNVAAYLGNGDSDAGLDMAVGALSAITAEVGVEVSDRYGVWDPQNLLVSPLGNDAVLDLEDYSALISAEG
jgi:hypothetical protein